MSETRRSFDIKILAEAAVPDATAYFIGPGSQSVKIENIGKEARASLESELLNGRFLEGLLHAIKSTKHDALGLQAVVDQIERIIDRLHTEKGTLSQDAGRKQARERELEQQHREAVGRANRLQADLEASERRWNAAQNDLLERVKRAEEEIQPRRLQAKVREQWPTIESELQYFLEWLVEERGYAAPDKRVDPAAVVGQYVALTKKDGDHG